MLGINKVLPAIVSRACKPNVTGAVQLQTATKKDQNILGRRLKLTIQSNRNDLRNVQITPQELNKCDSFKFNGINLQDLQFFLFHAFTLVIYWLLAFICMLRSFCATQ